MGIFKTNGFKDYKKTNEVKIAKSTRCLVPVQKIDKDGVFLIDKNVYSKTYGFTDINYQLLNDDEKENILEIYCSLLNSMDINFKITINNKNRNMETLKNQVLLSRENDSKDELRVSYNYIIEDKIRKGKQGLVQEKYITISVNKNNYEQAIDYFNTVENNLTKHFINIGSKLLPLNTKERLRIFHDFYRFGEQEEFNYDYENDLKLAKDFKNYVCPYNVEFSQKNFKMNDMYGKVLYLRDMPTVAYDDFVNRLSELPVYSMYSIDIIPIPHEIVAKEIKNKYMGIEQDIISQQRQRNKNMDFSTEISYQTKQRKDDIEDIMDRITSDNERMFYVGMTIVLLSNTLEELNSNEQTIMAIAKGKSFSISPLILKQKEGLLTVLPFGVRQVNTMQPLLTSSTCSLIPFNVQELYNPGGIYYGINKLSKNIIVGDRKKLPNGNGFTLGTSGSGKSFFNKLEILSVDLSTKDDILIIDPQNEYIDLCKLCGGTNLEISNKNNNHINPFELTEKDLEMDRKGAISDKIEFIISIIDELLINEITQKQRSIVTRTLDVLYKDIGNGMAFKSPTLIDFWELLKKQPESEASDIALALEMYAKGSLSMFSHQTNINVDNKFMVFSIGDTGKQLSKIAMLVILDFIDKRIKRNFSEGKRTWIYIDEIHMFFDKELSGNYLHKTWKQVRKYGGLATGMTQNITSLLRSATAREMLSNSEFVAMLKQSDDDSEIISQTLKISKEQMKYTRNCEQGEGLIKMGSNIIVFDIKFNKDNLIYKSISTNPNERNVS